MNMKLFRFYGSTGFSSWVAAARGRTESEAAQRVAQRLAGRKAGAYPTVVGGRPGWQVATPDGGPLVSIVRLEA